MGGTIAATDSLGRATMGIWDYGDYAVGSGRMVIMADVDYISSAGGANYTTLNSGAILGLNATEYLLQKNTVPDSGSSFLLLLPAFLGLAGVGYRRRQA